MHILGHFAVQPTLPARIARLEDLAYNLWWTWHPEAQDLFALLDSDLWEESHHNPVKLLHNVAQERLERAAQDPAFLARYDAVMAAFDAYMNEENTWFARTFPEWKDHLIAYFSAEFGLHEVLPIYSGGLGVLAGDHCKEASDLGVPLVGVGFLYPQGYFTQRIAEDGSQEAIYEKINFAEVPVRPARTPDGKEVMVHVDLPGRRVYVRVWEIRVGRVTVYLMDTDVPQNTAADRELAARLYIAEPEQRIAQEVILGIGGVRVLRALGLQPAVYHLNEGHSAFLGLERLRYLIQEEGLTFEEALEVVRATSLFTTHTPVAAGHDAFDFALVDKYFDTYCQELGLDREQFHALGRYDYPWGPQFSMTVLAIRQAAYVNGVSRLHGQVSRRMWRDLWPGLPEEEVPIGHITNGVHLPSWLAPELVALLDRHLPEDWRERVDDPDVWEGVRAIPDEDLWDVRLRLKRRTVDFVRRRLREQLRRHGSSPARIQRVERFFDPEALTIGFARRFATYKRATLIFRDLERAKRLLTDPDRPVQIIFAGKAHPADEPGKALIQYIHQLAQEHDLEGRIVFLENYDINMARYLVQGVDVWLNNPRRPLEASGTSGQKAAVNGVPHCSVLDGWWVEGYNGYNGWAIGDEREYPSEDAQDEADAQSLYTLLEQDIVPLYYAATREGEARPWLAVVRESMRSVAPYFNTRRMLKEYLETYYLPAMRNFVALRADGFRLAREMAAWRRRVREAWSQVAMAVDAPEWQRLRVGDAFTVRARVTLGPLSPEDVRVEVVWGRPDDKGELRDIHRVPLVPARQEGDVVLYEGEVRVAEGGDFAYGVRVYPYRPELPHPFDVGLILWAHREGAGRRA